MAQMLRDADSTEKHLSTTRRHKRLCNRVKGAELLALAIEPHYTRQLTSLANKKTANEAEEDAQDDRDLIGREGADVLRTISERAKQHDRDAPQIRSGDCILKVDIAISLLAMAQCPLHLVA